MNHQLISEVPGGVAEVTAPTVPSKVLIVDWDNITSDDALESSVAVRHLSPKDFEGNSKG